MTQAAWESTTWGDVVDLRYGKALRDYRETGGSVTVYGTNGPVGFTAVPQAKGPGVVVGRKGAYRGVHYSPADYWVIDTAFYIAPKRPLDMRWAYYALQLADINGLDSGSAIPSTTRESFAGLRATVPPFAEQQAIAEVLGALDDKIAANTALAATADLYASTLLLGSLGTDRVRLDSIARITMGSSPKGESLNELGEGVPFYQGVRDFSFRSPARRVFTTSPIRSADSGDILVSVRAPVGEVNIADEPICIGRGVAAVRSTTGTQATLFHQLKGERGAWAPYEAEGTVFGSINRGQLHGIELRLVRPERAGLVEHELATLESSIAATLAEDRTLAAIRDALLPRLMSGELRVADIEHDIASMDLDSSVPTDKEPS